MNRAIKEGDNKALNWAIRNSHEAAVRALLSIMPPGNVRASFSSDEGQHYHIVRGFTHHLTIAAEVGDLEIFNMMLRSAEWTDANIKEAVRAALERGHKHIALSVIHCFPSQIGKVMRPERAVRLALTTPADEAVVERVIRYVGGAPGLMQRLNVVTRMVVAVFLEDVAQIQHLMETPHEEDDPDLIKQLHLMYGLYVAVRYEREYIINILLGVRVNGETWDMFTFELLAYTLPNDKGRTLLTYVDSLDLLERFMCKIDETHIITDACEGGLNVIQIALHEGKQEKASFIEAFVARRQQGEGGPLSNICRTLPLRDLPFPRTRPPG